MLEHSEDQDPPILNSKTSKPELKASNGTSSSTDEDNEGGGSRGSGENAPKPITSITEKDPASGDEPQAAAKRADNLTGIGAGDNGGNRNGDGGGGRGGGNNGKPIQRYGKTLLAGCGAILVGVIIGLILDFDLWGPQPRITGNTDDFRVVEPSTANADKHTLNQTYFMVAVERKGSADIPIPNDLGCIAQVQRADQTSWQSIKTVENCSSIRISADEVQAKFKTTIEHQENGLFRVGLIEREKIHECIGDPADCAWDGGTLRNWWYDGSWSDPVNFQMPDGEIRLSIIECVNDYSTQPLAKCFTTKLYPERLRNKFPNLNCAWRLTKAVSEELLQKSEEGDCEWTFTIPFSRADRGARAIDLILQVKETFGYGIKSDIHVFKAKPPEQPTIKIVSNWQSALVPSTVEFSAETVGGGPLDALKEIGCIWKLNSSKKLKIQPDDSEIVPPGRPCEIDISLAGPIRKGEATLFVTVTAGNETNDNVHGIQRGSSRLELVDERLEFIENTFQSPVQLNLYAGGRLAANADWECWLEADSDTNVTASEKSDCSFNLGPIDAAILNERIEIGVRRKSEEAAPAIFSFVLAILNGDNFFIDTQPRDSTLPTGENVAVKIMARGPEGLITVPDGIECEPQVLLGDGDPLNTRKNTANGCEFTFEVPSLIGLRGKVKPISIGARILVSSVRSAENDEKFVTNSMLSLDSDTRRINQANGHIQLFVIDTSLQMREPQAEASGSYLEAAQRAIVDALPAARDYGAIFSIIGFGASERNAPSFTQCGKEWELLEARGPINEDDLRNTWERDLSRRQPADAGNVVEAIHYTATIAEEIRENLETANHSSSKLYFDFIIITRLPAWCGGDQQDDVGDVYRRAIERIGRMESEISIAIGSEEQNYRNIVIAAATNREVRAVVEEQLDEKLPRNSIIVPVTTPEEAARALALVFELANPDDEPRRDACGELRDITSEKGLVGSSQRLAVVCNLE